MDVRKQIGRTGETAAAAFLEKKGIRIIEKNFHCKFGEIDLMGRAPKYLLVIEVKTRNSYAIGRPCEAVDYRKQRKICRTFDYYRMKRGLAEEMPVRFDVIEVDGEGNCHWIENAFEYIPLW